MYRVSPSPDVPPPRAVNRTGVPLRALSLAFVVLVALVASGSAGAGEARLEGRVLAETGPLPGAIVSAYARYADIEAGKPVAVSTPAADDGMYTLSLPPDAYYFTAKGRKGKDEFFSYHGGNPVRIGEEKVWLTLLATQSQPPEFRPGTTGVAGKVMFKGKSVRDAYISVYRAEATVFKGIGVKTGSVGTDGTFFLPVPSGKYVVIARKAAGGKRVKPLEKGDLFCYYSQNPVEVRLENATVIDLSCYPKGDRNAFTAASALKNNTYPDGLDIKTRKQSGIGGRVTFLDGRPAPGLFVLAARKQGEVFLLYHMKMGYEHVAQTDGNGRYFIPMDEDEGEFHIVTVNTLGEIAEDDRYFYGLYNGTPMHTVAVKKGQRVENIDIIAGKDLEEKAAYGIGKPVRKTNASYPEDHVLDHDTVWSGTITVRGKIVVKRGVTLTIEPGTAVKFARLDRDRNGVGDGEILVEGKIDARGTKDKPVRFLSAEKEPAPKDWSYIVLLVSGADNRFEHCRFQHAFIGLQVHYSRARVTDCIFEENKEGLRFSKADFIAEYNTFRNNGVGFRFSRFEGNSVMRNNVVTANDIGALFLRPQQNTVDFDDPQAVQAMPRIRENNIYGNNDYNMKIGERGSRDVEVQDNWWGSADASQIKTLLFDRKEDAELGSVIFMPYRAELVVGAGARSDVR